MIDLRAALGEIDIYLFEQLLRERVAPGARVLDAGCRDGRNLARLLLLRTGSDVSGEDVNPQAIEILLDQYGVTPQGSAPVVAALGRPWPAKNVAPAAVGQAGRHRYITRRTGMCRAARVRNH